MTFAEHLRLSWLLRRGRELDPNFGRQPAVRQLYQWACLHVIEARYTLITGWPRRVGAQELVITPQ